MDNANCMLGGCLDCASLSKFDEMLVGVSDEVLQEELAYFTWAKIEEENAVRLLQQTATVGELIEKLRSRLPGMRRHVFVQKQQSTAYKNDCAERDPTVATIVVDVAARYKTIRI